MSIDRSLNYHAQDILRTSRRVTRLEVVLFILIALEAIHIGLELFK